MAQRYHHGNLREGLLAAAEALIGKRGAELLTLREVARQAGVTHAAPYHHFRNKDELLAAVAARGFAELEEDMRRAAKAKRGATARARLLAICDAYESFTRLRPARFAVMFGPLLASGVHPDLSRAAGKAFYVLVDAADEVAPGRGLPLALAGWSLVHGWSHLRMGGVLASLPLPRGALPSRASSVARLLF